MSRVELNLAQCCIALGARPPAACRLQRAVVATLLRQKRTQNRLLASTNFEMEDLPVFCNTWLTKMIHVFVA
jgi:hypothetical protein